MIFIAVLSIAKLGCRMPLLAMVVRHCVNFKFYMRSSLKLRDANPLASLKSLTSNRWLSSS